MMFFIGTAFGLFIAFSVILISSQLKLRKSKKEYTAVYTEVRNSIGTNYMRFNNRVNNTVVFKVRTQSYGSFDLILFLDKNEINLLKNNNLIYTSNMFIEKSKLVDQNLIDDIIYEVDSEYPEMNDVIQIQGNLIDRMSFEKMKDEHRKIYTNSYNENKFDNDPKEKKFNLDDILDKINKVGLKGLSSEELQYLKDQSK